MPANKYRENGSSSDTDHRRFIGISIADEDQTIGVIRVLRPSGAKPFVKHDERLLELFGEIAMPLLRDYQKRMSFRRRHAQSVQRRTRRMQLRDAFAYLAMPCGPAKSSSVSVNQILQSIAMFLRDWDDLNDAQIVVCYAKLAGREGPKLSLIHI